MGLLNKKLQYNEGEVMETLMTVLDREDVDGHNDSTNEKQQTFGFSFPLLINNADNLFSDDKVTVLFVWDKEFEIYYCDINNKYRILLRQDAFSDFRFRYFNNKFQLRNRLPEDLQKKFNQLRNSFYEEERSMHGKQPMMEMEARPQIMAEANYDMDAEVEEEPAGNYDMAEERAPEEYNDMAENTTDMRAQ